MKGLGVRARTALHREAKWLPRAILRCAAALATPRRSRRGTPAAGARPLGLRLLIAMKAAMGAATRQRGTAMAPNESFFSATDPETYATSPTAHLLDALAPYGHRPD